MKKYVLKTYPTAKVWDEELQDWRPPQTPEELEYNERINAELRKDLLSMLPPDCEVEE